ncbi:hypothetical protein [Paenibacillus sp. N3.4]|uniref:hypothetical protein n=1 Tax=Paenibacillus sp. N3.4 TaxID=2603222 RepID=UPI0011C7F6DA|nr:hypothetical protein [Paenibacillus sp. N3.4]TXK80965.1 hypothetical protein FU659_17610 [Paenibacillus sp. N3.4]
MTTDTRISEGDYTVTVSGLDAATVDKTTATFKATDEQVTKIDFVNASDTVAYSKFAVIKLKAANQYGEAVSLGTSSFTALVSGQSPTTFKKDDDGNLVVTADVTKNGTSQGNGIIPVTVYFNNSNITVSKNFKVGTVPILSKIEAGKVTYSNNGTRLTSGDDTASIAMNLFDQYGNPVVKSQLQPITPQGGTAAIAEIAASNINPVVTPYEQNITVVRTNNDYTDFFDDNDNARIKIKLANKLDKTADYTVNIYGGSSSATATISVGAGALATKVEFDTSGVVIAAGDQDVKVPLIVTDAAGNKLSAADIANDDNKGRFSFTVTNGTATLVTSGADKGKLNLNFTSANTVGNKVYISGQIQQSQTNTFVQSNIAVQDARVAERITVTTEPAAKAIFGASDKVVYQLKDQYGSDIDKVASNVTNQSGQVSNYRVRVDVTRDTASTDTNANKISTATLATAPAPVAGTNTVTYYFSNTELAEFNKGFNVTSTSGSVGKVTVKATIEKAPGALGGTLAFSDYSSSISRSYEAIKSDASLTYSLNTIGNLFAAIDKFSGNASIKIGSTANDSLTAGAHDSRFDKKIGVTAKDSSGATVKLPYNFVKSVSSTNPTVVSFATATNDTNDSNTTTTTTGVQFPATGGLLSNGFVIGNKAGTATVSVVVYTNKGATLTLTQDVTVKDEAITVDSIVAGKSSRDYLNAPTPGATPVAFTYAYEYFTKDADNQLKVKDQYGIEYKNADIARYNAVLGVSYTVTATGGSVDINPITGQIGTITSGVTDFTITASAPNGKSVQVVVKK